MTAMIDFRFDEQGNRMIHCCGREEAEKFSWTLGIIYEIAAETIPAWNGEIS